MVCSEAYHDVIRPSDPQFKRGEKMSESKFIKGDTVQLQTGGMLFVVGEMVWSEQTESWVYHCKESKDSSPLSFPEKMLKKSELSKKLL